MNNTATCTSCGQSVDKSWKVCPYCGNSLENEISDWDVTEADILTPEEEQAIRDLIDDSLKRENEELYYLISKDEKPDEEPVDSTDMELMRSYFEDWKRDFEAEQNSAKQIETEPAQKESLSEVIERNRTEKHKKKEYEKSYVEIRKEQKGRIIKRVMAVLGFVLGMYLNFQLDPTAGEFIMYSIPTSLMFAGFGYVIGMFIASGM